MTPYPAPSSLNTELADGNLISFAGTWLLKSQDKSKLWSDIGNDPAVIWKSFGFAKSDMNQKV